MPPAVTALMPLKTFHPDFLEEALGSLREQVDPDWEAVIVVEPEDHSSFARRLAGWLVDPRLRLVCNDGGRYPGAFNTGMRQARAEFVSPLFADDRWAPEAVAVLRAAIRSHPEIDFFHSSRRIIDDGGRAVSSVHEARADVHLEDFTAGTPVKHLLCWRRRFALALGGVDERVSIGPDDFDLPWLMAEHGARFLALDACLYVYRDHRSCERLSTDVPRQECIRQLDLVFRKHGLDRRSRRRRIEQARADYLRQCLWETEAERRGSDAGDRRSAGWRSSYR